MLLLDSQVLLWVLDDNPRLGARARHLIATAAFVHVSAATVWELTIKSMLKKLDLPDDFDQLLEAQGLVALHVKGNHARALVKYPELVRHDPFDRLLVAQATVEGLRLLTADAVLLATGYKFIIDATR